MHKKELEAFAREAAKTLKTEKDLNEFSQMLTKTTVDAALSAELDDREIVATFKEIYGADISPTLISKVTDAVIESCTFLCGEDALTGADYGHRRDWIRDRVLEL